MKSSHFNTNWYLKDLLAKVNAWFFGWLSPQMHIRVCRHLGKDHLGFEVGQEATPHIKAT